MKIHFFLLGLIVLPTVLFSQMEDDEEVTPLLPCGCGCNKRTYGGPHADYAVSFMSGGVSFTLPDGSSRTVDLSPGQGISAGISIERLVGAWYLNNSLYINLLYTRYGGMENSFAYKQEDNTGATTVAGNAFTRLQASFVSVNVEYKYGFGRSPFGIIGGVKTSLLCSQSLEQYIQLQESPPALAIASESWEYNSSSHRMVNNTSQVSQQKFHAALTAGLEYQIVMRRMTIVPSVRYSFGLNNFFSDQTNASHIQTLNAGVDWRFAL